jgi:hypothetical protein
MRAPFHLVLHYVGKSESMRDQFSRAKRAGITRREAEFASSPETGDCMMAPGSTGAPFGRRGDAIVSDSGLPRTPVSSASKAATSPPDSWRPEEI